MITKENSIPTKSKAHLNAESIFYVQFNSISFYIEDKDSENFFFEILKKIFPKIRLGKIFPLNGKDNVLIHSALNLDDKTKVYIVDKDFDDLLDQKKARANLFYLKRYSIENFLLEKNALIEYIISEKPRLTKNDISRSIQLEKKINQLGCCLLNLIQLHLVVQDKCKRLKNIGLGFNKFAEYQHGTFIEKTDQIEKYKLAIQTELNLIDKRFKVQAQLLEKKKLVCFRTNKEILIHYPGKFLVKMIKQLTEIQFGIPSRNFDSFCYRLAQKCEFTSLRPLKTAITKYTQ